LENVWGSSADWQDEATVTEHVRRLRAKLNDDPDNPAWIITVRGVGYRFERGLVTEAERVFAPPPGDH
jgi:DNA-binding response OmpR family regulator